MIFFLIYFSLPVAVISYHIIQILQVKPDQKLSKVFRSYADHKNLIQSAFKFYLDEELQNECFEYATFKELGISDGSVINVMLVSTSSLPGSSEAARTNISVNILDRLLRRELTSRVSFHNQDIGMTV